MVPVSSVTHSRTTLPSTTEINCSFAPTKGSLLSESAFTISVFVSSSNISTNGISSTVMFSFTVKYTFSATRYPSGALVSMSTYSPGVRYSIS